MKFDKYFREELAYLREQGRAYSQIKPHLSSFLDGKYTDPDVERLLEGFAFLTGRLRQKLDDDFPELTHSVINMLWPNYLRPFPSVVITKFSTINNLIQNRQVIDAGVELSGYAPESKTHCPFQTCRSVTLYPLERTQLDLEQTKDLTSISLDFEVEGEGSLGSIGLEDLTFFLGEASHEAYTLYLWFHHFLSKIEIYVGDQVISVPLSCLKDVGFEEDEGILPYPKNVYQGYRVLHEYLVYPESFLFLKLDQLSHFFANIPEQKFQIKFSFRKSFPHDVRITERHLQLYCVPAINLFKHDADPISLEGFGNEYIVKPSRRNPERYEIFCFNKVEGWGRPGDVNGVEQVREYHAFEGFQHEEERERKGASYYYRTRVKENILYGGLDHFISFSRNDELSQIGVNETISLELLCSNRFVPLELGKGDITTSKDSEPAYITVKNITEPSMPLHPMTDERLLWMLISNLALNYTSLLSQDSLKTVIKAYDFRSIYDRQAEKITRKKINEGILDIKTKPIDRVHKGLPIRGIHSTLTLDETAFASEGDLFLFAKVLSQFFRLYASINSFHELTVINAANNEHYFFGAEVGRQPLI